MVGLTLNHSKTQYIIIGSHQNLQKIASLDIPPVVVGSQLICPVSSVKSLGVYISSDLTWNDHTSSLLAKLYSTLIFLYNKCSDLPIAVRINLVTSMVFPILDYCCLVFANLTGYLLHKLSVALSRAIRFIFKLKSSVSITPYRKKLGWLDIATRHQYFLGVLTYKVLKTKKPQYLYLKFEQYLSINRRPTRQLATLDPPNTSSATYSKSFIHTAME